MLEATVQYVSIFISISALLIGHKGMKPFIPVGMFASLYANLWCYLAKYFSLWEFPLRLFPFVTDISVTANIFAVPVLAMFWVRYSPMPRISWALLWSTILTGLEYIAERYTDLITYSNGYEWYITFILWIISWYLWYYFHVWFWKD